MRTFREATPDDLDRMVAIAIRAFPMTDEAMVRTRLAESPWADWSDRIVGEDDGVHEAQAALYEWTAQTSVPILACRREAGAR